MRFIRCTGTVVKVEGEGMRNCEFKYCLL